MRKRLFLVAGSLQTVMESQEVSQNHLNMMTHWANRPSEGLRHRYPQDWISMSRHEYMQIKHKLNHFTLRNKVIVKANIMGMTELERLLFCVISVNFDKPNKQIDHTVMIYQPFKESISPIYTKPICNSKKVFKGKSK